VAHLLVAGVLCVGLSLSWVAAVELTPSKQRPFVGSSTDNTELGLTFGYNGFERVGKQKGGPGPVANREVPPSKQAPRAAGEANGPPVQLPKAAVDVAPKVAVTITKSPTAFGTAPGPLRLFRRGFGDQGAWMLAFALFGLLALVLARPTRGDPKLAPLIVFGGFFLCEVVFLSASKGIVHPYYLSALAPGVAVMVGAGLTAMTRRTRRWPQALLIAAVLLNVAVEIMLLHHAHYLGVWQILLAPAAIVSLAALGLTARGLARCSDDLCGEHLAASSRGHVPSGRSQRRRR
jgi:4-amino-4-deoxy-L-arabinose transferase-like glycosyltransferase